MEKDSRFFEVPDDVETKIRLLFGAPPDWIFSVSLEAPQSLIDAEQVSIGTRFAYDGNIYRQLEISSAKEKTKAGEMDCFGIIVEPRLPQFVGFADLGYREASLTRHRGEQIAAALIRKGFLGGLVFHSRFHRDHYGEYAGHCHILLQSWEGGPAYHLFNEGRVQPAHIRLDWSRLYGGSEMTVEPYVLLCQELGLREYVPEGHAAKAA